MEVVASLSQGRTAAAQCGLFTHKSVPVICEPPCILFRYNTLFSYTSKNIPLIIGVIFCVFARPTEKLQIFLDLLLQCGQ